MKSTARLSGPWLYSVAFFLGVAASAFAARRLQLELVPPVSLILIGSFVQAVTAYAGADLGMRLSLQKIGRALFLRFRTQLFLGAVGGALCSASWTALVYLLNLFPDGNGTIGILVICAAFFLPPYLVSCLLALSFRKYVKRWLSRTLDGKAGD